MMIVDAQVHTWTGGIPPYVHRQQPFSNEELLSEMDAVGVQRAILVPPAWDPGALAHADDGARDHPDRFAIMAGIPIETVLSQDDIIDWRSGGRLGFRMTFATPERLQMLSDGRSDWFWAAAEAAQIPVMLAIWGELSRALPIVERHPNLRLVIDHLGIPVTHRTMDDAAFSDIEAVMALSRHANIAIKASGLPAHSTEAYPYRNLHSYLRRVFDAFGPERMFWGTDLTRMPCSYRQCITLFTEELAWLSEPDKNQVMGLALCNWLGWPAPDRTEAGAG